MERTGVAGATVPAPAASALVALEEVSFAYPDGPPVLDRISLTIPEGAIVAIVGPSGCGKSTLLSIIAGLMQADRGRLAWAPDQTVPARHPLTMMFQKDTLLPWLTVRDNVGLCFKMQASPPPRQQQRERIQALIRLAGLEGSEDHYPYQLSGGMKRRTAFLSAVAPRPRALLLDEPFSALDEPTRIGIHQDIFDIVKRDRIGALLITHDLGEAISLSDHLLVLTARPATICARYDIPFGDGRRMLGLRDHPEFLELYGEVWHQLSAQIQRSTARGAP
jgi:NitT/TauT family transport system ATP-binding protein